MLTRSLLALALLTTSALAQPAAPAATSSPAAPPASPAASIPQGPQPGIVRGLCQRDGCDEFSLAGVETVKTTAEGTLKRTRLKAYHSSSAGREERQEEAGYVYCSTTTPAVVAERAGKVMAFYIAPFATEDSAESVRKFTNFFATYFAVCHGPTIARDAVRDLAGTATRLGYQVEAASSRVVPLKRPEDVIGSAALASAPTAPERRAERPIYGRAPDRGPEGYSARYPQPEARIDPYAERPVYRGRPAYADGYDDAPGYRYPQRRVYEDAPLIPPANIPED